MTSLLKDRVAIVTGGGNGFGASIVEKYVEQGAKVVAIDIKTDHLQESASIAYLTGDVSQSETWEKALTLALDRFGGCHILVNNAGITRQMVAHECSEEYFDKMISINIKALYLSVRTIFPQFLKNPNGGVLVNLASTGAFRPRAGFTWYNATKGAVVVMTKSLAVEYGPKIRCNCISPAIGNTSMLLASYGGRRPTDEELAPMLKLIPMARLTEPQDVGNAAVYLASDLASFVTGTVFHVDGGRTI